MSNRILIKKSKVTLSQPPVAIGRGAMGEVYLAAFQNKPVVVKKSQREMDTLLKEYSNYLKLRNHTNVLKFYGVIRDDKYTFSLVLEYASNGNLSSYLKTHTVDWNFKSKVCRDIALGLMHCHENNVLHFDLKPENILLDKNLIPKLADFGISKTKSRMVLDNGKAGGTLNYVAPERVCRDIKMRELFENHPKLSDIYSYGLILWSVAKDGEHPYEGMDDDEIKEQKRNPNSMYHLVKQLPSATPYSQLVLDLTKYYPGERIDLAVARLELEYLFDDDDMSEDDEREEEQEPHQSIDDLSIDDLEPDEDDEASAYNYSDTSSNNVSTTTSIETPIDSEKDLGTEVSNEKLSTVNNYNKQNSGNKLSFIKGNLDNISNRRKDNLESNHRPNNSTSDQSSNTEVHDRGLFSGFSDFSSNCSTQVSTRRIKPKIKVQTDCQASSSDTPKTPKAPPFDQTLLASHGLMEDIMNICDNWEKYTDDIMIKKLEHYCREKGKKPKDIYTIFEENPTKSPDYYFVMGFFTEHGFGRISDPKIAFSFYSKAAEFGDPRGEVYVGWCYFKGMGTTKSPIKAFNYFQRAANRGCVSAHNNVGWCHDIGFGTTCDPYKAFEFFKIAGEKGYATAQCRVGVCYEYGRGTIKDLEKALEWYQKAADNGHEAAKKRVSELTKIINRGHRRRSFWSFIDLFR
ncbi:kinase-like protein [Gigaspora margarita]|uniref:Kinase-like protein n=1 Tax=Gigaspora margarita TaxID=4874 RepID=A0A8H3WZJ8_GIGMA|nr:kinase-like protein [Gigaspora margarita]